MPTGAVGNTTLRIMGHHAHAQCPATTSNNRRQKIEESNILLASQPNCTQSICGVCLYTYVMQSIHEMLKPVRPASERELCARLDANIADNYVLLLIVSANRCGTDFYNTSTYSLFGSCFDGGNNYIAETVWFCYLLYTLSPAKGVMKQCFNKFQLSS